MAHLQKVICTYDAPYGVGQVCYFGEMTPNRAILSCIFVNSHKNILRFRMKCAQSFLPTFSAKATSKAAFLAASASVWLRSFHAS